MAVDIEQFHQVFFEESFEGLDIMESELLQLDPTNPDNEVINTIFRAAHSIKGGGGTFGFKQVSEFTHGVETLLDRIREGTHKMVQSDVDLLLESVDCLRGMFNLLQNKEELDLTVADTITNRVNAILDGNASDNTDTDDKLSQDEAEQPDSASGNKHWKIHFKPDHNIFKTGNEPQRLFRELSKLGDLTVIANTDDLPCFGDIVPDECYLSWNMELYSEVSKEVIEEVFEWVIDDSELTIEIADHSSTNDPSATKVVDSGNQTVKKQQAKQVLANKSSGGGSNNESSSIRVGIDKIDSLINMVGELVITQSMLSQLGDNFDLSRLTKLQEGLTQLEQNTRELQESVMQIRMLPISFAFSRFPRMVRDLSKKLGKEIELVMSGEGTELDKTVMEKIGDPLVHLVRNSVDHGIEPIEERKAVGKSETGIIHLNAYHQGGNILIEISDDGAGLNTEKVLAKAREKGLITGDEKLNKEQIHDLIFQPGFSTAEQVSDVSGRGVGMDVVRRNIRDLGGSVHIKSEEGVGTTFTVRLPLTLAILDGQLVQVGDHIYILPLISIVESLQVKQDMISKVGGGCNVLQLREEYIPVLRLSNVFNIDAQYHEWHEGLLVVVESSGEKVGVLVDDLQAQQQVVIKSLEQNYQKVEGVSGATILGDGTVALILDIAGLVQLAGVQYRDLQQVLVHKQSDGAGTETLGVM